MKIFFALLLIIFLAFSGYHLTFRRIELPLFARKFYLTGTEYLFLGLLLGPQFFNLLDSQTLLGLEPLFALLLGWIGLIFGFQFEIVKLRRFPLEFLSAAIIESLFTFIMVFLGVYFTLPLFLELSDPLRISGSLTLSAAAACTAQTGLVLFAPDDITRHTKTVNLLRYISSIDGLSALLIFSLAFFYCPAVFAKSAWIWKFTLGTSLSLSFGIGLLLYTLFFAQLREESELTLVVIGTLLLTSGTASILHFSPLLTNFFIGFCLVNISKEKERIYNILIRIEKPVYLLLLIFLGGCLRVESALLIVLSAGYWLYRFLGKFLGGFIITRLSPGMNVYPRHLGFGLLDQGGLPLAILFDFHRGFPSDTTTSLISLALLAIIYNDFLSPHLLTQLLKEDK
ncbi:MAG: hypothetical protein JRI99_04120 [Deltaproteobacteria bacterium]|nr:hypothetical protein [Deltaproteobacteria bacterium]